ncbi:MAG: hypothetical protein ACOYJI_02620 [Anaerovoracaceae bacterium]
MERKKIKLESGTKIISGDTTLSEWTIQCIDTYKVGQREITRKKYIALVRHCILEEIGDLPINKITPMQCQQIVNLQSIKVKHRSMVSITR